MKSLNRHSRYKIRIFNTIGISTQRDTQKDFSVDGIYQSVLLFNQLERFHIDKNKPAVGWLIRGTIEIKISAQI